MKKLRFCYCLVLLSILLISCATNSAAEPVRYYAPEAAVAPGINGLDDDACWDYAEWGYLDVSWFAEQPWFDGEELIDSTDFYGRYKVVWKGHRLFFLMEITDDVLNDDIEDPLDLYWEEDCIEVFLDEDQSGGNHERGANAFNAFAYHISPVTYDAVDFIDVDENPPRLLNEHVEINVASEGNHHIAEFSICIYDESYKHGASDNIPVELNRGKVMGFTIAYCDDDGNGREDFFANQPGGLNSYIDADLFGEIELIVH